MTRAVVILSYSATSVARTPTALKLPLIQQETAPLSLIASPCIELVRISAYLVKAPATVAVKSKRRLRAKQPPLLS